MSRLFFLHAALFLNSCFQSSKFSNNNPNDTITVPGLNSVTKDLPENYTNVGEANTPKVTTNAAAVVSPSVSMPTSPTSTLSSDSNSLNNTGPDFTPFSLTKNGQQIRTGNIILNLDGGRLNLYSYINNKLEVLWHTPAACSNLNVCRAEFRSDGHLILFEGTQVVWSRGGPATGAGAVLSFSDTAPYMKVLNSSGSTVWSAVPRFGPFSLTKPSQQIRVGNIILNLDGGRLNLYSYFNNKLEALWHTPAACSNLNVCRAEFRSDGHLILLEGTKVIWSRGGSAAGAGAVLSFSDTAPYMKVLNSSGSTVWSAGSHKINNLCASNSQVAPIYIVAGQSNALGTGKISETTSEWIEDYWNKNGFNFAFWSIGNGSRNDNKWQLGGTVKEQFIENQATFGPELSLAAKLQESGLKRFYIFKAAWGSSSLSGSQPDGNNWLSRGAGKHYDTMISTLEKAATEICASGLRPVVKGVYWMQGESDAAAPEKYKVDLKRLIDEMYQDVLDPTAPFVIGKIKSQYLDWEALRTVQDSFNGYLSKVATIDTNDFSSYFGAPDVCLRTSFCYIHYNTQGQIQMGYRVFQQFQAYATNSATVANGSPQSIAPTEILCEADRSGQTNASPTIMACVDKLPLSGGTISLLPGTYLMQTRLNVTRSNVKFRTKGLETSQSACDKVACASFKASATFTDGLAFFYAGPEVSGTSLDHIVFDGNRGQREISQIPSEAGRNALIYDVSNSSITHSIFMNTARGTALGIGLMPTPSTNVYFAANKFINNGDNQSGYWADGLTVGSVANSNFIGNTFIDNSDVAMIFGGAANTKITNNYFQQTSQRIFAAFMTTNWSVGASEKTWADFRGMLFHSNTIFCGGFCDVGVQLGVLNFDGEAYAGHLRNMGGSVFNNVISGSRQLMNVSGSGTPDFPIRIFNNTFDRPNGVILPHRISNTVSATDYNIERPWDWSFVDTFGDATPISSYTWGKLF